MAQGLTTATLSAVGATLPFPLGPSFQTNYTGPLLPGLVAALSSGAVLTYSLEVTGDVITNDYLVSYAAASGNFGNWAPLSSTSTGLTASTSATIQGKFTGVRLRISAYTSGSANLALIS